MKTVKHTTFSILGKEKQYHAFTRNKIQKAIWIAQGYDIKTFVVRQGNYGTAIKSWIDDEGLLERISRGQYRLTTKGYKFAMGTYKEGVKLIRRINEDRLNARRKAREERDSQPHIVHANKFQHLVGLTIVKVRYCTPKERDSLGWHDSPIILHMSDGSLMFPQSDDEGNNGGVLALFNDKGNPDLAYVI